MWQSCALKLVSVRSFIETRLLMFEENPVGTLTALSHWHTTLFSYVVRLLLAPGRSIFPLYTTGVG